MTYDQYYVQKLGFGYYLVRRKDPFGRAWQTGTPRFFRHSSAVAMSAALNAAYDVGLRFPPSARDSA